ncbi:MAG: universal stress protein [Cyclobacteriaceae bacterium]|nr:universal stress protein [Cyclobacteriaceae bacterium]MBX2954985.1 universal stress protein [Cyclobacteriaceae bacterium]
MKAILCALDFTKASGEALKEAIRLANEKKTHLIVLYTYRLLYTNGLSLAEYRKQVEAKAREEFELLLSNQQVNQKLPIEFIIEIGFLSDRIESYVAKNKVECLVMCEKLAQTMNENLGISLEHFTASLKIPVVIIPESLEIG